MARSPVAGDRPSSRRALLLGVLRETEPGLDLHQHEVARLACIVGDELGMQNEELDVLARAAELHDIGKMATPDAILHKPGPLDDREWEIMRRHTVVGERILNSVSALRPVATVVRSTHERVDGSGYPDGLRGGSDSPQRLGDRGQRRVPRDDQRAAL
ncbi:MAG: HD domain-containing protein [Actinobacteria bacterium]|nr:HD domain-containing protein [Actinomycetota bacterium]